MTEYERVCNQDDRKFIAGLQLHFIQEGNEGSLETCTDFVQLHSGKRTWQVHLFSSSNVTNC
jgi:hypothetical protein